jgi:2-polyprenyl-3-methyl-5-hydroxy-6-metoxy-1,4-benzoquinol methylase
MWPLGPLRAGEQRAVQAIARVEPGSRVLDAGCGDGEILAWLGTMGAWSVGIDVTRAMAHRCHGRGFRVCVQNMERLAFRDRFDWVFCIGSLEFVAQPQAVLHGFAQCLRPAGRLALLFPRRNWLGVLYAAYHRSHGVRVHLFSGEQMTALLRSAGLEVCGWQPCALSAACVAQRAT